MFKKLIIGIPALVIITSAGAAGALTKSQCEAQGGTYSNNQGTKTCTFSDPSGNSGNSWDSSTSQQGSIGAGGTTDTLSTSCTNPGGHPSDNPQKC